MSTVSLGTMVGIGLILLAIYLIYSQPVGRGRAGRSAYTQQERQFQPAEIAAGELVLSEHYLRCDLPRRLGARVDQVYRTREDLLVPVDTKTGYRRVVRREDLVELSVQAAVLRHTTSSDRPRGQVASWGYVRKVAPGRSPVYLRTQLLSDRELEGLVDRYWLVQGGGLPIPASSPDSCRYCPIATQCEVTPARKKSVAA